MSEMKPVWDDGVYGEDIKDEVQVIDRAITALKSAKWTRGDFAEDENGNQLTDVFDPRVCKYCLTGALHIGAKVQTHEMCRDEPGYPLDTNEDEIRRYKLIQNICERITSIVSAQRFSSDVCAVEWNDHWAKNKAHVIKLLRRVKESFEGGRKYV